MAELLAKLLYRNYESETKVTLIEPYAGGAGASLNLLRNGIVDRVVINDLDPAIHAFWKTAVSNAGYLIRRIERTEVTISEWHRQRNIYLSGTTSAKKLAFATLFLNRTNRSGILHARPIGGLEQKGAWRLDARFTKPTLIERLRVIQDISERIVVYGIDALRLLHRMEQRKDVAKQLLFLDPPYLAKGRGLYMNHYALQDHQKLAHFLLRSRQRWILTYDDSPTVRSLYQNTRKRRYTINHSAASPKRGHELVMVSKNLVLVPFQI